MTSSKKILLTGTIIIVFIIICAIYRDCNYKCTKGHYIDGYTIRDRAFGDSVFVCDCFIKR